MRSRHRFGDVAPIAHRVRFHRSTSPIFCRSSPCARLAWHLPVAGRAEQAMIPGCAVRCRPQEHIRRSEEHTSELQSLMRISYAVFCLKKKNHSINTQPSNKREKKHNHKTIDTQYKNRE